VGVVGVAAAQEAAIVGVLDGARLHHLARLLLAAHGRATALGIDEVVDEYFLTGVARAGVVCTDGP
jgi:hypothetical protein